jgi:nicotinamidase-related amidase
MVIDNNAALILIDVQIAFDDPRMGKRNNPRAEANIARLLAAWRESGRPIIHVRHDSVEPQSMLRPGLPGNEIKPEAKPRDGEPVIGKHVNSAFIGTDLEQRLRNAKQNSVVIVGLTTDHCVSTTARMAGNLGFKTVVVADATAAFERKGFDGAVVPAEEIYRGALASLHGEFAEVVTTEQVLAGLQYSTKASSG